MTHIAGEWIPALSVKPAGKPSRGLAGRASTDYDSVRMLALLGLIVVLNLADLIFTLFAQASGLLVEMKPIAALLFHGHQELNLICMKFAAVTISCVILWRLRKGRWTVPACWLLIGVYGVLACMWILWAAQYGALMQTRISWAAMLAGR